MKTKFKKLSYLALLFLFLSCGKSGDESGVMEPSPAAAGAPIQESQLPASGGGGISEQTPLIDSLTSTTISPEGVASSNPIQLLPQATPLVQGAQGGRIVLDFMVPSRIIRYEVKGLPTDITLHRILHVNAFGNSEAGVASLPIGTNRFTHTLVITRVAPLQTHTLIFEVVDNEGNVENRAFSLQILASAFPILEVAPIAPAPAPAPTPAPAPVLLAPAPTPTASAIAIQGPTSVGIFTGGNFTASLLRGNVDFSRATWFISPLHPNTPTRSVAGTSLLVQPGNTNSFTLSLSVPDNNITGTSVLAQFGPIRVLAGTVPHVVHFDLQRIPISPDPGDGCYTVIATANLGGLSDMGTGLSFPINIGQSTTTSCPGNPGTLLKFSFDAKIPILSCAVPNCVVTIEIKRTDGRQINYQVNPTTLRADTPILGSAVGFGSFSIKKFSLTISNPGQ